MANVIFANTECVQLCRTASKPDFDKILKHSSKLCKCECISLAFLKCLLAIFAYILIGSSMKHERHGVKRQRHASGILRPTHKKAPPGGTRVSNMEIRGVVQVSVKLYRMPKGEKKLAFGCVKCKTID